MGGAQAAIEKARADFEQGQYRWVAEVMTEVVMAEPENQTARQLAADAMEQLGYQSESATWRNAYLLGAHELRNGLPESRGSAPMSPDVVAALTPALFFDYLAVRVAGPKAEGKRIVINWLFPDEDQTFRLNLENCALTYAENRTSDEADLTVTMNQSELGRLIFDRSSLEQDIKDGSIKATGDVSALHELFSVLDDFAFLFDIVEPNRVGQALV